ncbi:sphingolipid delta(4)-desaturase DES1-like [Branchiostoma floridae]|uniref:Sphingolipid delta(4)-desaturase DES1-like n=1 Tax=Branchiostoma floridae TaxID=7739 RepID=A0A9J7KKW4_BRAFL|nr:sphingolipid delta(4)-desaturase DES1-like [Branchiostoma floridae]
MASENTGARNNYARPTEYGRKWEGRFLEQISSGCTRTSPTLQGERRSWDVGVKIKSVKQNKLFQTSSGNEQTLRRRHGNLKHLTCFYSVTAKHPKIKELFGHDPTVVNKVVFMIALQLMACYFVQDVSLPIIILLACCFGGVINASMMTAIREISHNLAFGHSRPLHNRILGIVGNVIIAVPVPITFKKYHLEHHKYQGHEKVNVDLPLKMEGVLFRTSFTKFIWLFLQPFFYGLRPLFMRPKPVSGLEIINTTVQIAFDVSIWYFFGVKSLAYLIIGSLLASGVHPKAGHFISDHYMFKKGYETYSYYGPLNALTFNAGYHNEHHDFPNIPGCRLPKVTS